MRRIAAALAVGLAAGGCGSPAPPPEGGDAGAPPAAARLRADLDRLCDPALRGRGTLDGGSAAAAATLAAAFRDAGLNADIRTFEIVLPEVEAGSRLEFGGETFPPGADWLPLARIAPHAGTHAVSGSAVRGLAARISGDREAVRGRIVVEALPRSPGPFRPLVPSLAERALAYEDLGAAAVVFLPAAGDPDAAGEAACPARVGAHAERAIAREPESARDWLRRRAWIGAAARAPRGPDGRAPSIPALVVSPALARSLAARSPDADGIPLRLHWTTRVSRHTGHNVVATAPGSLPDAPALLLCAHFDSHGTRPDGVVYPGAADNAAGVAVLLAAARTLAPHPLRRPIAFAAFDGEELGLLGSRAFADTDPRVPGRILAVLNIDMAGRGPAGEITLVGSAFSPDLAADVSVPLAAAGFTVRTGIDWSFRNGSDHWPFHAKGVPAVLVTCSRFEEKDLPGDLPALVDDALLERTADAVVRAARDLASRAHPYPVPVDADVRAPWDK